MKSLRTCAIRLRPIRGVGKECSASRVLSIAARRENHRALRADGQELALAGDIHLNRVHHAAGGVQLDDMRQRHEEKPAVRVVHA